MARLRRGQRMPVNGEINVVSLIDVMMLLMVIFMIAAPMMQGGVDVTLPKADVQPLEPKGGLVVSINRAGQIYVDQTPFSLAEFRSNIKLLAEQRGRDGVFLNADHNVPYGTVVQVMAAMRASGVTDVGLVAEPEDNR